MGYFSGYNFAITPALGTMPQMPTTGTQPSAPSGNTGPYIGGYNPQDPYGNLPGDSPAIYGAGGKQVVFDSSSNQWVPAGTRAPAGSSSGGMDLSSLFNQFAGQQPPVTQPMETQMNPTQVTQGGKTFTVNLPGGDMSWRKPGMAIPGGSSILNSPTGINYTHQPSNSNPQSQLLSYLMSGMGGAPGQDPMSSFLSYLMGGGGSPAGGTNQYGYF